MRGEPLHLVECWIAALIWWRQLRYSYERQEVTNWQFVNAVSGVSSLDVQALIIVRHA